MNTKFIYILLSGFIFVGCAAGVNDKRLDSFATGLPKENPKELPTPVSGEYPTDFLQLSSEGVDDTDGDGIIDLRDGCDERLEGVIVDNKGCALSIGKVKTQLLTVEFAVDSAEVIEKYYSEISDIAQLHLKNITDKILIEGHTDSSGPEAHNLKLSKQRAESVARVLVDQFQTPREDILIAGFGSSQPVADNNTSEGRQLNRRMLVHVVYMDRVAQKQWNIWSVELGDKKSEVKQFYSLDLD